MKRAFVKRVHNCPPNQLSDEAKSIGSTSVDACGLQYTSRQAQLTLITPPTLLHSLFLSFSSSTFSLSFLIPLTEREENKTTTKKEVSKDSESSRQIYESLFFPLFVSLYIYMYVYKSRERGTMSSNFLIFFLQFQSKSKRIRLSS